MISRSWEPARKLTRQQFKVVALLYHDKMGYSMIAERLGLSIRTVRHHVAAVALWLPGDDLDPAWKVLIHAGKLLELGYDDDPNDDEEAA